jgi:opacity protein-like surface antigen
MKHTRVVAALLVASACMASANATEASEQISAGYDHLSAGNLNGFSGRGDLLVSLSNPGLNIQLSGGDEHFDISGTSVDIADISGSVFWRDRMGTFGASVAYHRLSAAVNFQGMHTNGAATAESYGAFGEYYFNRSLTLRVKGGAFSGDFEGYYGGGGVAVYPSHNMAISANYDYVSLKHGGHSSRPGASFEILPYEPWPATVTVNYAREMEAGGYNVIGVVLKWHFGAYENDLRAWDRAGPTQWTGALKVPL